MGFSTGQIASTALTMQIGGAVTSGIGSYMGAKNQKATLGAQAAVADTNARISELGAQGELRRGQGQVASLTLKAGQLKSAQRARLAANGVDLGQGSAAEVQASTDLMKEIDVNTLTANAVQSAWGYRTQGTNFTNEGITRRAAAKGISPLGSAATSLMSSAGQVASSWYSMNKSGALKGTMYEAPEEYPGLAWKYDK
jgi:hypothetical protein